MPQGFPGPKRRDAKTAKTPDEKGCLMSELKSRDFFRDSGTAELRPPKMRLVSAASEAATHKAHWVFQHAVSGQIDRKRWLPVAGIRD